MAVPAGGRRPWGVAGLNSKRANRYFFHMRIYRRTFLVYLLIVLFLVTGVLAVLSYTVRSVGLNAFSSEANSSFMLLEQQLTHVSSSIDALFVRLYSTTALREDFFHFFNSSPSEYVAYHLDNPSRAESYLDECGSLVAETDYCISHILHYGEGQIADTEYSREGYSRWRSLSEREAEELCRDHLTISKDVDTAGSVTFVIEPTGLIYDYYCAGGEVAASVTIGGTTSVVGDTGWQQEVDWESLAQSGPSQPGIRREPEGLLFSVRSSSLFGYTLVSAAPWGDYMSLPLRAALLIGLAVAAGLVLITLLYARKFSSDSGFIQSILDSMSRAESSDFVPVDPGSRRDEYAAIAQHLNSLYEHLQALIEQRYVLTISQQRAEIQRLSAQLNPHFLYNTLESMRLRALREGDAPMAEATGGLGSLYRSIVKTPPVITIGEELEIARKYLDLMSFLQGDSFVYHLDVPSEAFDIPTPKIWMQPIVENFFKHDFQSTDDIKVVVISGELTPGPDGGGHASGRCLSLEFFSNLGHIEPDKLAELNRAFSSSAADGEDSGGIGLTSVWYRLRLFYGGRMSMEMSNNAPTGVSLHIRISEEASESDVPASDS